MSSGPAIPSSKSITGGSHVFGRGQFMTFLAGDRPLFTPQQVALDLLFFRRIFSNLYRCHGDSSGEVPVSVFQRSVVRLFRVLGMKKEEQEFDCEEYDVDGSGAVGWYEFVTCWRKSQVTVYLSPCERIYLSMEDPGTCVFGRLTNILVTLLIFISCICFISGTLPQFRKARCDGCEPEQLAIFDTLEHVCIMVFTLEYGLRLCTVPFSRGELLDYNHIVEFVTETDAPRTTSPITRTVKFVTQPMNVIDLFVIVPYYLEIFMSKLMVSNFAVLRVLRLTRLFRLIKLGKAFEAFEVIIRVFHKSMKMLQILGVYLILGICFSSATMYFVEGGTWDQNLRTFIRTSHDGEESESPFKSVPHAFWWCVVTFTTVGYGDVVPVTVGGKAVAACTMLIGILVLAMPISVISMNFSDVWSDWVEERRLNHQTMEQDLLAVSESLEGLESKSRLKIEVFDDRAGMEKPEFLGEVQWTSLPVDSTDVREENGILPLQLGRERASAVDEKLPRVQGNLSVGYTWNPAARTSESKSLQGSLTVRINYAEGLRRSDWKKAGQRDVYAVVHCWPRPPSNLESGTLNSTQYKTSTLNSLNPVWEESTTFEFCWPLDWKQDDMDRKRMSRAADQASTALSRSRSRSYSYTRHPSKGLGGGGSSSRDGDALDEEARRKAIESHSRDIELLKQQVGEIHLMLRGLSAHLGVPAPTPGGKQSVSFPAELSAGHVPFPNSGGPQLADPAADAGDGKANADATDRGRGCSMGSIDIIDQNKELTFAGRQETLRDTGAQVDATANSSQFVHIDVQEAVDGRERSGQAEGQVRTPQLPGVPSVGLGDHNH